MKSMSELVKEQLIIIKIKAMSCLIRSIQHTHQAMLDWMTRDMKSEGRITSNDTVLFYRNAVEAHGRFCESLKYDYERVLKK